MSDDYFATLDLSMGKKIDNFSSYSREEPSSMRNKKKNFNPDRELFLISSSTIFKT